MNLKGKVAIVTGASGGIGRATARLLTGKGAKVVLAARSKSSLEKLSQQLPSSFAVPADMTKPSEIRRLIEAAYDHYGRIDILVNNAGQGYDAPIAKIKPRTLRQIFELDFVGPLLATQATIPLMKQRGGGVIINVSSGTALMHLPGMGAYAAVKAALAHLSLTAREELKSDRINVGVVYPYITDTDFEKNTIKDLADSDQGGEGDYEPPKADSADYAAGLILKAIESNQAETYAHDWMKPGD